MNYKCKYFPNEKTLCIMMLCRSWNLLVTTGWCMTCPVSRATAQVNVIRSKVMTEKRCGCFVWWWQPHHCKLRAGQISLRLWQTVHHSIVDGWEKLSFGDRAWEKSPSLQLLCYTHWTYTYTQTYLLYLFEDSDNDKDDVLVVHLFISVVCF